ncbi:MAG: hypothetical protein E7461_01690 [Ruminococcaceae bacterium]|nr:hypothetical protein [Oscillospiraceae bacterium]
MIRQKIKDYLELLNGKTLSNLSLACEMMMFTFDNIAIHSQCFTRILYRDQILLTTLDYQNWDETDDKNNDEWYNLSLHKNLIINNRVSKAQLMDTNDLFIWLENNIQIQMLISNSSPHYVEDSEQWRIFQNDSEDFPHTVIYSNSIQDEP